MSIVKIGTEVILPFRSGLATEPFKAALPAGRSITVGRLQTRLPDHKAVTLVARDRHLVFSAYGYGEGGEDQANGLSDGELRIYVPGENAAEILNRMLPVFRLNPQATKSRNNGHTSLDSVWFAGYRELNSVNSTLVGLVQDLSINGRGALFSGGLDILRDNRKHLPGRLEGTYGWLESLFQDRRAPKYDELAHHVLGLTQAIVMDRDPQPLEKLSQDQMYEVAENAFELFDVQSIANALVVGALGAVAHLKGEKGERAAEYRHWLDEVMNISPTFTKRSEDLFELAENILPDYSLSFVGAAMFLLVGRGYLEVAQGQRYMGLRSQRVRDARIMFDSAYNRMDALKGETTRIHALRSVFMDYAQRQMDMIG